MRRLFYICVLVSLLIAGIGFLALADLIQFVAHFPNGFTYGVFSWRWPMMGVFALSFGVVLALGIRYRPLARKWLVVYALGSLALFGGGFVNPSYLMFRSQQHDAHFVSVAEARKELADSEEVCVIRLNGVARAYVIDEFDAGIEVINDTLGGVPIVVAGSAAANIAVTFRSMLADGTVLDFAPSADPLPTIMVDNEGNTWDVFGEALTGTRSTEKLALADSYIAYWFAWAAFNADSEIDGR